MDMGGFINTRHGFFLYIGVTKYQAFQLPRQKLLECRCPVGFLPLNLKCLSISFLRSPTSYTRNIKFLTF